MSRSVRGPDYSLRIQAQERDLSFAAHCEGYGLEWLDMPEKEVAE